MTGSREMLQLRRNCCLAYGLFLILSLCIGLGSCNISGSGENLLNPLSGLLLETDVSTSTLNITFSDSEIMESEQYLLNYTASVNNIIIQEGSDTVTTTSYMLQGDFIQSGVTITVEVQAMNTGGLCDPLINSTTIDGEFSPSPESFSISNETPTSLNLSWSIPFPQVVPDSFSLDYDINKLSGAPATTTTDSLTIDISNTSVTDNGGSFSYLLEELTAHTEYSFSLSSNYGSSTSAPITASAVTDQDKSTPPVNFMVTAITNTSASFQWSPPLDANGIISAYHIFLRDGAADIEMIITNLTEPLQATFSDLQPFVSYIATIFATNGFGNGTSNNLSFSTSTGIPTAPNLLRVIASGPGDLTVTWEEPSSTNGEIINYNISVNVRAMVIESSGMGTEFVVTGLEPFTDYSVRVQACTSEGCGPFSNEIMNATLQEAPSPPTGVTAEPLSSDTIRVSWTIPDPANGIITDYRVTYNPTSSTEEPVTVTTGGDVTELNITGLIPFTNYTLYVEGVTLETGDKSADVIVMTLEDAPTAPTNVIATEVNSTHVTVEWDEPDTPNGIVRQYIISYNLSGSDVITLTGNARTVTIGELLPFTFYEFTVVAFTIETGPGASDIVRTEEAAPTAPTNVIATAVNSTHVTVEWGEPDTLNGIVRHYIISYNLSGSDDINVTGTARTVTIGELLPFTFYEFTVVAFTIETGPGASDIVRTGEEAPTAPTNVIATEVNSTHITVEWDEPDTPNGIVRQYIISYNLSGSDVITLTGNARTVTIGDFLPFTFYEFTIVAFTIETGPGASDIVRTGEAAPTAPTNVIATAINSTHITVEWDEPDTPNGIVRQYIITYNLSESDVITLTDTARTVTIGELLPFTFYEFTVVAFTIETGPGASDIVRTGEAAPTAPTNVIATEVNSTYITVEWDEPDTPNGIVKQYIITYNLSGSDVITLTDTARTVTIGDLLPFTFYEFTIVAFTIETGPGASDIFRTGEAAPTAPTNVIATAINSTHITVEWDEPDTPNGIVRQYIISYNLSESDVITLTDTARTVTIGDLLPFTFYEFTVVAFTIETGPGASDIVRTGEAAPTAPTNVIATEVNSTHITVEWDEPDTPNGIVRQYIITYNLSESDVITLTGNARTVTIGELLPFTFYEFTVVAFTIETGPGASDIVRTEEAAPTAPTNVIATEVNSTHVTVEWGEPDTPNGIVRHYIISYNLSESDDINVTGTARTVTIGELLPFTFYEFTVVAFTIETGPGASDIVRTEEAASTAPTNVIATEVNSTHVTVEWGEPDTLNGIVRHYIISYNLSGSDDANVTGTARTVTIGELLPFTFYEFTVVAFTIETGPGASDIVRTEEAAPTAPTNVIATEVNSTHVTVEWGEPDTPNGIVRHYIISYNLSGSDDINVTGTARTVTIGELLPFTFYEFTVVAFTIETGPGASDIVRTEEAAPTAPTNVIATEVNSTHVTVEWGEPDTPNGIVRHYIISYNLSESDDINVTGTARTVTIGELLPFTFYEFTVIAFTIETGPGASDIVRTEEAAPTAPTNVIATEVNSTHVTVEWGEPDTPNGIVRHYIISYNLSGSDDINVTGTTRTVTIGELLPFTFYEFTVVAFTIETGPGASDIVRTEEAAPSAPLNLMAVAITAFSVSLQWDEPEPTNGFITSYIIQYHQTSTPTTMFNDSIQMTSFMVVDLIPFTDYVFSVSAVTVEEGPSVQVNAMTAESIPSAPLNVAARNSSSTSIIVDWSTPAFPRGTITSYSITFYITMSGEASASTMVVGGTTSSVEIKDLMKYTEYTVFVHANTSVGRGDRSESVTVTTDEDIPSAPRDLTVNATGPTSINITWSAPVSANGILLRYIIDLEEETGGQLELLETFEVVADPQIITYSFSFTNLMAFVLYRIEVSAETRIGEGPSTDVFETTDPSSASPPSFVSAVTLNSTAIEISWGYPDTPRGSITGYIIYHDVISNGELNLTLSVMNDMGDQTYVFSGLMPFTNYQFRVAAFAVTEIVTHFGMPSEPVVARTDEDLPTMPLEFTLEDVPDEPNQLFASWMEPQPPNGVIVSYSLTCTLSSSQYYPEQNSTGPPTQPTVTTSGDVTEATVMGLLPFTNYTCSVTANTSVGEGPPSIILTQRTVESVPSAPRDLTIESVSTNATLLSASWVRPLPANGIITAYTLYCTGTEEQFYEDQIVPEQFSQSLEGNVLSTTLEDLLPFTMYECNITASTSAGEGDKSPPVRRRTNETSPLDSPQNFVSETINSTSIQLSWDRPSTPNGEITHYSLVYNVVGGPPTEPLLITDTMFTVEDLNEYTVYVFSISAATSAGLGPSTETSNRTDEDAPTAGVQELNGVNSSSTSLNISWMPPPQDDQNGIIRAYNISYGLTTQTRTEYVDVSTTNLTIELTLLEKFTVYEVVVSPYTIAIGPEESVKVRTDSDLPSEPLNLQYMNISAISIRVFWDPPTERNGVLQNYRLMYEEFGTEQQVEMAIPPGNESEGVVVEPLMEYHMYSVRVAASTDKGFGPYSSPLEVLTDEHEPDAPENFTVTVIDSSSVRATWEDPLDSNGIIVHFSLTLALSSGQGYLPQPDTPSYPSLAPSQFELLIPGLHPFARYVFILSATTSFGEGNMTDAFEMTNEAAPSQGVRDINAPVISSNEINLMWTPPELENWNGILTNYTIDIVAVQSCQMQEPLEQFPDSPRSEFLDSSQFKTLPNPTDAYGVGGVQLESLSLNGLEEYQSYTLTIRVWNSQGRDSEDVMIVQVCNRTNEAAPTGSPSIQSFLITSDTTAELKWQPPPPLEQNGVIVDYSIELCSNRTGNCSRWNMGSNDTFYNLEELTPFTTYSVAVAALTSEGQGPDSPVETNMTFQGLPTMPSSLMVDDYDHNFITLSWLVPETPNGIVDLYRVTYQGFKDESLIDKVACNITDGQMRTTPSLTINLTQLTGDSTYCIHVSARTGAGYGDISSVVQDIPNGPPPVDVIDPDTDPLVVPQPVVDPETGDDGITDTSATVMFTLPAEIEENGPVDRVLFYVQRMPSSNTSKGTWYESSRASSEWPQYAALAVNVTSVQRRKRATDGLSVMATIGNSSVRCGPDDIICNGPLDSNAQYGVRYTLFSGDQSQEYPFFDEAQFTTEKSADNSATIGAVVGGVIAAMVVVVAVTAVIVVVFYCFMGARRKGSIDLTRRTAAHVKNHNRPLLPHKNGSAHGKTAPFLGPSDPGIVPLGEIKNAGYTNTRSPTTKANSRRMMLKDLSEAVRGMLEDAGYVFSEEYERVTEVGLEHSKEASLMAENRAKNRYTNILAYDHSRVKLSYVDDEPGSDYINASYIPGYRMRRAYIATQGPLPATFDDFWRMVWEQNTHSIVMLTQLVERGRTKCHRYWPGAECIVYGEIAVEMMSEKEKDDWTLREFKLSIEKKSRIVKHFQFTSWPDHGVPETPTAAIDFVRTVRDSVLMNHGPLVVHCSAGVGRTGCFIALDTLLQHIEEHDFVDIFGLASEMRQHRNHMIQTEAQYIFVHKAMVEFIDTCYSGKSPMRFSAFPSLYTNQFAEDSTQMSDYYGDFLSEETHM